MKIKQNLENYNAITLTEIQIAKTTNESKQTETIKSSQKQHSNKITNICNICQQIPHQRNLHLQTIAHNINIITEMSNTKNLLTNILSAPMLTC